MRNLIISRVPTSNAYFEKIKMEVFDWGMNAALLSGLHTDVNKARLFAKQKVLEVFDKDPNKQHCFKIDTVESENVGRAWLTDKRVPGINDAELRLCYIKIDEMHQRKKMGREAISLLEDYGCQNGFNTMSLNVFSHLDHATNLYIAMGFKVAEQIKVEDKIVATEMRKPIPPRYINSPNCKLPIKFWRCSKQGNTLAS